MNYILVYSYNEWRESGGGTYIDLFDSLEALDAKADEILKREKHVIDFAGEISREYKYKPKEFVTKFVRE